MDPYYCIVGTAGEPVAELCALDAQDDGTALERALAAAGAVAGWEQVSVYAGERLIDRIDRASATPVLPLAA